MALMADDGLARAIYPSHTVSDGDTIFSLATGRWPNEANVTVHRRAGRRRRCTGGRPGRHRGHRRRRHSSRTRISVVELTHNHDTFTNPQNRGHRRRRHRPGSHSGGLAALERAARGTASRWTSPSCRGAATTTCSHGRMMDDDGFERLAKFDAIYLGAIGDPSGARPHRRLGAAPAAAAALSAVRQPAADAAAARPRRRRSPTAARATSTWSACARTPRASTPGSAAASTSARRTRSPSRPGSSRATASSAILRYAFELAATRPRKLLASATKSNALQHSMVLWDEVAEHGAARTSRRSTYRKYHVDALAARMVTHPQTLDVIVASNLFGDILTDIGSAISGSLGIAPGREHQPRARLSVDVRADSRLGAGHRRQGHRESDRRDLGRRDDARSPRPSRSARSHCRGDRARRRLRQSRTPDLGGQAKTQQLADAICSEI